MTGWINEEEEDPAADAAVLEQLEQRHEARQAENAQKRADLSAHAEEQEKRRTQDPTVALRARIAEAEASGDVRESMNLKAQWSRQMMLGSAPQSGSATPEPSPQPAARWEPITQEESD